MFHLSQKKFKAYIGGVGSGKTKAGCFEALKIMLTYPGSIGIICAPTYTMLRDATQTTFFEICPFDLIKDYYKQQNKVVLMNGSVVLFRTADNPDHLRGPNLDWFYMDEASECPYMAWKILIGRIRKGVIDAGFATATPKGFNWLYDEFGAKKRNDYELFRSSSLENKYLSNSFLESLKESYSGTFYRQEVEGEFTSFEGLVYPSFTHANIISVQALKNIGMKYYVGGIDFGFTNPYVSVIIGIDNNDRAYVLKEIYQRRILTSDMIKLIKDWREELHLHKLPMFSADPSEPALISEMQQGGLNVAKADNEVLKGIQTVSGFLTIKADGRPSLFVSEECQNTINEFNMYRFPDEKEGKVNKDTPLKINDHAMDAIRYALHSWKNHTYTPSIY